MFLSLSSFSKHKVEFWERTIQSLNKYRKKSCMSTCAAHPNVENPSWASLGEKGSRETVHASQEAQGAGLLQEQQHATPAWEEGTENTFSVSELQSLKCNPADLESIQNGYRRGDVVAGYTLARYHQEHLYVTEDQLPLDEEIFRAQSSVHAGSKGWCHEMSFSHFECSNKSVAVRCYENGINEEEDEVSMTRLAVCCLNGNGIQRDANRAMSLLFRAAQKGYPEAFVRLGKVFYFGCPPMVTPDAKKAFILFEKAAEQGDLEAMIMVGECCERGKGAERDIDRALAYFKQASEHGHLEATYRYANCLYVHGSKCKRNEKCRTEREREALSWFRKAANRQHSLAICRVGEFHQWGTGGLQRSGTEAVQWYERACPTDTTGTAQCNLANCYETGEGVEHDVNKANEYYTEAIAKGNIRALTIYKFKQLFERNFLMRFLFRLFFNTYLLPPRPSQTLLSGRARFLVGMLGTSTHHLFTSVLYFMVGGLVDDITDEEVLHKLNHVADKDNNMFAMYLVAFCYQFGHGGTRNERMASLCYKILHTTHQVEREKKGTTQGNKGDNLSYLCYLLGMFALKDDTTSETHRMQNAVQWFARGAEEGDAQSMFRLGEHYLEGKGVEKDETQAVALFKKAALKGEPNAMRSLGICYCNGTGGVEKNEEEAVTFFRKAIDHGARDAWAFLGKCYENGNIIHPFGVDEKQLIEETYQKGVERGESGSMVNLGIYIWKNHGPILSEGDAERVFSLFSRAAGVGNTEGLRCLGKCYAEGIGVQRDEAHAGTLISQAAEEGSVAALCTMGEYCLKGTLGIPKDERGGVEYFRRAASMCDAEACFQLGLCCEHGRGTDRDLNEAIRWYEQAGMRNHAEAAFRLGVCYETGQQGQQDVQKAFRWYMKAVTDNPHFPEALYKLGLCCEKGWGTDVDLDLAVDLFRRAANEQFALGMFKLGVCYRDGKGVEKNEKLATEWFRRAGGQGHAPSLLNLGVLFREGRGIDRDDEKGAGLYREAAERGLAEGKFNLGICYQYGLGVQQDDVTAARWFQEAVDQGHAGAMNALGVCYCTGKGVERDEEKGLSLFQRSADLGHPVGKRCLESIQVSQASLSVCQKRKTPCEHIVVVRKDDAEESSSGSLEEKNKENSSASDAVSIASVTSHMSEWSILENGDNFLCMRS
uniref:Uncharacterized protein n=1 Tax=Palpitomonas bilix TaxID=652834 RepID=A0A7S3CVF9_9EUKA|mmetsp:Transcript_11026/g.28880  ORF Transcript_11026/g.28880 Transcript_11026/m.28880 type:complete len:1164 (+) Transcript_11026:205-3696(+)